MRFHKADEDRFYRALLARDPSFEGVFIVGVRTTGIFCRSVCRARKPKRENVEFFEDASAATRAGYRPCKVCLPTRPPTPEVPAFFSILSRRIHSHPDERILDEQIVRMGFVPATVRRWFKAAYGLTFQEWQRMVRLNFALGRITEGTDVTSAALGSGYESLSGFGESFKNTFGFAPSKRGTHRVITAGTIESPLGPLLAGALNEGLCYLQFMDHGSLPADLEALCQKWKARLVHGQNKHLSSLAKQLELYFAGRLRHFELPLCLVGTPFQERAWQQLRSVPYGSSLSYQQQAAGIGSAGAVRAIGTANRRNPIAIVIPCHRIVGKSGDLRGYAGGLWRKRWLLDFEARCVSQDQVTGADDKRGLLERRA